MDGLNIVTRWATSGQLPRSASSPLLLPPRPCYSTRPVMVPPRTYPSCHPRLSPSMHVSDMLGWDWCVRLLLQDKADSVAGRGLVTPGEPVHQHRADYSTSAPPCLQGTSSGGLTCVSLLTEPTGDLALTQLTGRCAGLWSPPISPAATEAHAASTTRG